jgi:hypothetical protein
LQHGETRFLARAVVDKSKLMSDVAIPIQTEQDGGYISHTTGATILCRQNLVLPLAKIFIGRNARDNATFTVASGCGGVGNDSSRLHSVLDWLRHGLSKIGTAVEREQSSRLQANRRSLDHPIGPFAPSQFINVLKGAMSLPGTRR